MEKLFYLFCSLRSRPIRGRTWRKPEMSVYLQLMQERRISSANHITMIHPTQHPDRVLEEHDFLYMIDGTWEIGEETGQPDGPSSIRNTFRLGTDDLVILPAGRHHFGVAPCSPRNRHMYIHVTPLESERRANRNYPSAASGFPASFSEDPLSGQAAVFSSLIHCRNAPRIRALFEEIISESWGSSALKQQKLSLLFNLLLCALLEQQEKKKSPAGADALTEEPPPPTHPTPQTFFTGKELADRFYVCERTLTNHFKSVFGKTLYAYQMDVKLEMVRQFLLTQPGVKLHETALNFGFCDEFHLSRAFRRKYGISPDRYRKNPSGPAASVSEPGGSGS